MPLAGADAGGHRLPALRLLEAAHDDQGEQGGHDADEKHAAPAGLVAEDAALDQLAL